MRSFYSPISISALFYGYLKRNLAIPKGKKSKQGCEIQESNSGPLAPGPRTNRLCHPVIRPHCNLKPRDIVIVSDDNIPRNLWQIAPIEEVCPDVDSYVRKVKLALGDPSLDCQNA